MIKTQPSATFDETPDQHHQPQMPIKTSQSQTNLLLAEIERHRSSTPTNYLEWRKFCEHGASERPAVPTGNEWTRMAKDAHQMSQRERWRYHARFSPIRTPTVDRIIREITETARENLVGAIGARTGYVISADPMLGKTTLLFMLGREYEAQLRKRYAAVLRDYAQQFVPVTYNIMGSQYNIRHMNEAMADFYGTPYGSRESGATIGRKLIREAKACLTSLIIIDDIHHVRPGFKNQQPLNDHIKMLSTAIPATFVYAGVNVHKSGFFREGHGEQVTARFKKFTIEPYIREDRTSWSEYLNLLVSLESHICLLYHQEGDLMQLADHIYNMTRGRIGAIVRLVRESANQAIRSGTERLTLEGLQAVKLDNQTEDHFREQQKLQRTQKQVKRMVHQQLSVTGSRKKGGSRPPSENGSSG
jgi:hypothetical protein